MITSLNETIRRLRIARGLNQVEFAKLVGVTKQCVSNWENDNVLPSIEMLIKISDVFRVSTDHLLGIEQKKFIDASGLTDEQTEHIAIIIEDMQKLNKMAKK